MKPMSKWDRVEAALRGDAVDRVPISFWRHYFVQEWAPARLAELTLGLYRQFDLDLIKLTASGSYPIQNWGPAIRFSRDDNVPSQYVGAAVASADEWERLPRLDVTRGSLGRELETIRHLAAGLDGTAPFLMTIYSPLTVAAMLRRGDNGRADIIRDLRESPRQLHAGLAVIRDVVRDYTAACLDAGVSGFFFATQLANYGALTRGEYEEFGVAYDLPVLESFVDEAWITMLHVCSEQELMFDLVAAYPVDIINWADRDTGPSLAEARELTDKPLAGGLSVKTLLHGTEEDVLEEARDAIAQAGRTGFILAPACVYKGRTPERNLAAARQAVEETVVR
jgi:uroporphyrinogen decarboxylase